jgi:hypothetical protein
MAYVSGEMPLPAVRKMSVLNPEITFTCITITCNSELGIYEVNFEYHILEEAQKPY